MIHYNTSNDKQSKKIVTWCKENGCTYSFDTKNKERREFTYPFDLIVPREKIAELKELLGTEELDSEEDMINLI